MVTASARARFNLLFLSILLALFSVLSWSSAPAFAANITTNQCDGIDNAGGGQNTECDVTIVNTLDQATGVMSATVTTKVCAGAAGAAPTCISNTVTSADNVTSVDQCNGSTNAGGGTVLCTVSVTNNITGTGTTASATTNQCVDSGTGGGTAPTTTCDPTGITTGATVTQCNGSGNGGGGSMRVKCTVASESMISSVLPVSINQCNGSGNGGGALVICSARILTAIIPPAAPATPSPTPSTPTTPAVPAVPAVPAAPSTPAVPSTPTPTPSTPAVPKLPETGANVGLGLGLGASALALGGLALLIAKRRKLAEAGIDITKK